MNSESATPSLGSRLFEWFVLPVGSTRSLGLLRIGIVALIWCRWAGEMVLVRMPGAVQTALALVFFLVTALMFVGLWTRLSSAVTALVMVIIYYYFGIAQGFDGWAKHHTCLLMMSAVLIALTPCGRSLSLDRYLAVRRSSRSRIALPDERGALWGLRLIQIQVFCVYFWSVADKLDPAYLGGERLQAILMWLYGNSSYPEWPGFASLCQAMAWASVLIELTLAVGLFFPRWLKFLIPLGILLHGSFYVLFPVSTFSLNMILLYLAFVPAARVHRVIDQLLGGPEASPVVSQFRADREPPAS